MMLVSVILKTTGVTRETGTEDPSKLHCALSSLNGTCTIPIISLTYVLKREGGGSVHKSVY